MGAVLLIHFTRNIPLYQQAIEPATKSLLKIWRKMNITNWRKGIKHS